MYNHAKLVNVHPLKRQQSMDYRAFLVYYLELASSPCICMGFLILIS